MLYQWDVTKKPLDQIVESMPLLLNAGEEARTFARVLAEGAIRRIDDIDASISQQSDSWRLERMATVDRNILRVAIYELMETETPKSVVINEALEVTKRYSVPDAVSFVNGVLDAVGAAIEGASESR